MFSDDGARDLSSVQALQRKHQGFQVSDYEGSAGDALWYDGYFLRMVPTFVTAPTFWASRDTRVSYGWWLLIPRYFCAV